MIIDVDDVELFEFDRIGIVPYVVLKKRCWFLLGKDARTGDYCDFGGRIEKYETKFAAAIREFMEETKEIMDPSGLSHKCAIYDKRNKICIIFSKIKDPSFYLTAETKFQTTKEKMKFQEMSKIKWFSELQMIKNIYKFPTKLWNRVKFALCNCSDFNDQLLETLKE